MALKRFDSINIVPLIDVMLVLLVITLTTATFISQGILPVTPPQAKNSDAKSEIKTVELYINKDGKIALKDKELSIESLKSELEKLEKKSTISIIADKDSRFEHFIIILDMLKGMGFLNVTIVTNK